ncbi:MAG: prolyl oligopeptidase family serine peptidase [Pirellulaceae bacterium]|nr:prolyl oligopeptidase family serine peptidase [Pirellulaceae bacterium]
MLRTVAYLMIGSCCFLTTALLADGPADNIPTNVRRVPKLGIEVPAEQRKEFDTLLAKLRTQIDQIKRNGDYKSRELWPDVEIFYKSVHDALVYQEIFDPQELGVAGYQLGIGMERARLLQRGEAPWTTDTGLVVRGYVSKIDGSVQPYGLVIPESYNPKGPQRYRTDLWFHGRGEVLSEVNFVKDRMNNLGPITPDDTIVLHPYGRYCNAAKFAGEIDALEALDSVKRRYRVDEDRISVRGFSMGGASAWHFAVHYPDRWFAANPGAGFSETPDFLKVFQKENLQPTWWERKLWQWYDCPGWAANLRHCPVVAYSGELDSQKQAADIMEPAMRKEGIELRHVIGPGARHSIHPEGKEEVERRMNDMVWRVRDKGDALQKIDGLVFETCTLRYNRSTGISIDGLEEHWRMGRIKVRYDSGEDLIRFGTAGISDFTIDLPIGLVAPDDKVQVIFMPGLGEENPKDFNPVRLDEVSTLSDRSLRVVCHKVGDKWKLGSRPSDGGLRKKHGLQGPIDDAFLDSFIFVRPTGKPWNEMASKWSEAELTRAIEHWRRQFRGNARVKNDVDVTQADMESANIVLWGDPGSNSVLAKIAEKLPIQWTKESISLSGNNSGKERRFPADKHALIAIYPNPLFPYRYIVLNSSFTYRDFAYLNNARQVPMLPDWAVVNLTTPPNSVWPGRIADADFFDERWQLKPPHAE